MRPVIRVYLYDENGERFFGEGPLRLLHAVEETGSRRECTRLRVYAPNDRRTRRRRQRADR